jgi:hypothetical protein
MPVNVALLLLALFVPADAWRSAYRRGHQGMSGDDESTSSACAQFGVGERAASAANYRQFGTRHDEHLRHGSRLIWVFHMWSSMSLSRASLDALESGRVFGNGPPRGGRACVGDGR